MTKLLLLTRSLELGGTEAQLTELAIALARRDLDILVVTFYPGGVLETRLTSFGIRTACLHKKGRWEFLPFISRFYRLVASYKPNHIYSFLTGPNLLATYIKIRIPSTKVYWGFRSSVPDRALRNGPLVGLMYLALRLLSFLPNLIIVNSKSSMESHVKLGFPKEKLVTIPNGIEATRFKYDRHAGLAARKALDIDPDSFVIGMVGRLDPVKGHKHFLTAAHHFLRQDPNTVFLIAASGSTTLLRELKVLEHNLGLSKSTRWILEENDLTRIYNAMDIFTLPSLSESFPNALVEALACGTPSVASDVGDCKIILGNQGALVEPGNDLQLVAVWQSLRKDKILGLHEKRISEAADRIAKTYSVEKLASHTIRVLDLVD